MKRFAIIAIFLSLLFVGNAHAENQSTTDYKIEQIKEDIKKLETDLKKLEDDVDDSKDNKLENKKDLESLDKRIDDVGGSVDRFGVLVAFFSIFITLLIVSFGFVAYKNARGDAKKQAEDATKEWIENEGNRQLEPIIKKLQEEAQTKIEEAVKTAKEDIERQSKAEEFLMEGKNYYFNKEYNEAIKYFHKAINENYKYSRAYSGIGRAYKNLEQYEQAIIYYKKAIEMNIEYDRAYINLFSLQLSINQAFELENRYIELFKDNNEKFIQYEMLKILQSIVNGKNVDIDDWKNKYKEVKLDLAWYELDTWISNVKDGEIKTKLLEVIEIFKNHNKD